MDAISLEQLKANVNGVVDLVNSVGSAIAPEYKVAFALGSIVAKAFPDLLNDVENLLSKTNPTQDDNDALARKIHALANPESL